MFLILEYSDVFNTLKAFVRCPGTGLICTGAVGVLGCSRPVEGHLEEGPCLQRSTGFSYSSILDRTATAKNVIKMERTIVLHVIMKYS